MTTPEPTDELRKIAEQIAGDAYEVNDMADVIAVQEVDAKTQRLADAIEKALRASTALVGAATPPAPDAPHPFQGNGERCEICGRIPSRDIHIAATPCAPDVPKDWPTPDTCGICGCSLDETRVFGLCRPCAQAKSDARKARKATPPAPDAPAECEHNWLRVTRDAWYCPKCKGERMDEPTPSAPALEQWDAETFVRDLGFARNKFGSERTSYTEDDLALVAQAAYTAGQASRTLPDCKNELADIDAAIGEGSNTRYCGCDHFPPTWSLSDKQKECAKAALTSLRQKLTAGEP